MDRKIILVWNSNINKYTARFANKVEVCIFKHIDILQKEYKTIYNSIELGLSKGYTIDNDMYFLYSRECDIAYQIDSLAIQLGIEFNTRRHMF